MRPSSLRRQPTLVDVGPAGYQEFTAGTIPVRGVLADEEGALVLVEHQRGVMRAFDEHLGAVEDRRRPARERRLHRHVDRDHRLGTVAAGGPARAEDRRAQRPTETPVQGRDDVAAVAPRRRRLPRAGPSSRRPGTGVCVELHVVPRPDSRGWAASPASSATSPCRGRSCRRHPDISAAARSNGSLSPAPAPNRGRAGPPSADEHRKHLRRRRSCVTSPPRPCRET